MRQLLSTISTTIAVITPPPPPNLPLVWRKQHPDFWQVHDRLSIGALPILYRFKQAENINTLEMTSFIRSTWQRARSPRISYHGVTTPPLRVAGTGYLCHPRSGEVCLLFSCFYPVRNSDRNDIFRRQTVKPIRFWSNRHRLDVKSV